MKTFLVSVPVWVTIEVSAYDKPSADDKAREITKHLMNQYVADWDWMDEKSDIEEQEPVDWRPEKEVV